jgi:serine protease
MNTVINALVFSLLSLVVFPLSAQAPAYVPGDLIVRLEKGADVGRLTGQLQAFEGQPTQLEAVELLSPPLDIWLLHFDAENISGEKFLEHVRRQSGVRLAQFNHYIEDRGIVPNDPQLNSQWQWINTGQNGGTPGADVDADEAWEITTGGQTATGKDIVVAVVESGINLNHPDLAANMWINEAEIPGNGIDDDNNGYIDDYKGWNVGQNNDNITSSNHGTQVSGMIGAVGNNDTGVTGINWSVKIMAIARGGLTEANVVASYTYPYVLRKRFNETNGEEGAFVVAINSSWGIDGGQPANAPIWCDFYDELGLEGILSCGATANNNVNIDEVGDLPTACPSEYLISVTATNSSDIRTFSGYGTTHIDLAAPGASIFTTSGTANYGSTSGTSFATPLTAGIIALMYSAPCIYLGDEAIKYPAETALKVRDALFAGVDPKSNLLTEVKTGGRANAHKSVLLVLDACDPCPSASAFEIGLATENTAELIWKGAIDAQDYTLRYRPEGAEEWDTIFNAANPFALTGLESCGTYEAQVFTQCSEAEGDFSESFFFTTEGCCVAPDDVAIVEITDKTATIQWNEVLAATGYTLTIEPVDPELPVISLQPGSSVFLAEGLSPCNGYRVILTSDCVGGEESEPSQELVFFTLCPCPAPENADTSQVNMTSAVYSWQEAENATSYTVRYKEISAVNWEFASVTDLNLFLENLEECKNYRVQVKTICPIAESPYNNAIIFKTLCTPSSAVEPALTASGMQLVANPIGDKIKLWVELQEPSQLQARVFDALGRLVANYDLGAVSQGAHAFELPAASLAPGMYWVHLETGGIILIEKAVKQ